MKKIFTFILCFLLLFCMLGCNFNADDTNDVIDNFFKNYQAMGKTESGAYSNFKNINVQSSYLGYGYDVINDPYMSAKHVNTSYPIIDMNKIDSVPLLMEKINAGDFDEAQGSTMEEFYQDYTVSLNVYGKAGKCFSGGLKLDFTGSLSEKTYWYFYKLYYYYDAFYISITNTVDQLQTYLSESFKTDLINIPVQNLFDKYGTHLIKEASMGGRIERSITYTSTSTANKSSMDAAVNAHIKAFGASINAEVSGSTNSALEQAGVTYTTKTSQTGGKAISLSGELNYEKWAESFDESLEYATLCGIKNENSLIGIWELLPNGYENRKTEIENAFIQISGDRYTELCNTFKLSSSSNTPEDTTWTTITKTLERTSLQDNNKYDPSKKNSDKATIDRHASWELGTLNLYGFEEKNDKFIIKNASQLSIKYNLLQNIDSLPLCSGIQFYYVNSDTTGGIAETNVSDSEAVGKGAYWIRITYTDDTQTTVNKNNCLDGKAKGEFIELLSADDINQNKVVKKIELVFVYELVCGENLFLDWWTYPANFRCEFVMNF